MNLAQAAVRSEAIAPSQEAAGSIQQGGVVEQECRAAAGPYPSLQVLGRRFPEGYREEHAEFRVT